MASEQLYSHWCIECCQWYTSEETPPPEGGDRLEGVCDICWSTLEEEMKTERRANE